MSSYLDKYTFITILKVRFRWRVLGLFRVPNWDTAAQGMPAHSHPFSPILALLCVVRGLCTAVEAPQPAHPSSTHVSPLGFWEHLLIWRSLYPEKGTVQALEVGSGLFEQEVLGMLSRRGAGTWVCSEHITLA